jgi:hypothetical protein
MESRNTRRKFEVQFAAGENSYPHSAIWRVWAARNSPDLFLTVVGTGGQIKATVHCPHDNRPTWKRHLGFSSDAKGQLAEFLRAGGQNRHLVTWTPQDLGNGILLEWRIHILGTALKKSRNPASEKTNLLPLPAPNACLVICVLIAPPSLAGMTPCLTDGESQLFERGNLSDGRVIWIMSSYPTLDRIQLPKPSGNKTYTFYGSPDSAPTVESEMRAIVTTGMEGGFSLWDMAVDFE